MPPIGLIVCKLQAAQLCVFYMVLFPNKTKLVFLTLYKENIIFMEERLSPSRQYDVTKNTYNFTQQLITYDFMSRVSCDIFIK